jgi:hypothetical protein
LLDQDEAVDFYIDKLGIRDPFGNAIRIWQMFDAGA